MNFNLMNDIWETLLVEKDIDFDSCLIDVKHSLISDFINLCPINLHWLTYKAISGKDTWKLDLPLSDMLEFYYSLR